MDQDFVAWLDVLSAVMNTVMNFGCYNFWGEGNFFTSSENCLFLKILTAGFAEDSRFLGGDALSFNK